MRKELELRKKFRNITEIKRDMEDLNMIMQTDFEIMKELIEKFEKSEKREDKLAILKDLEYLVHQVFRNLYFLHF